MDKKIKIFATVVFICALIYVIPVILLICTLPDSQTTVLKDQICLTSESGSLHCGKRTELLSDYLKGIIVEEYADVKRIDEKKQQDYLDKNRGRLMDAFDLEMKPAAKLTGKEQPSLSDDDIGKDMVAVGEWHHADGLSDTSGFLNYGIRYRKGRLIVPVHGTYFIYSNLDFFENCNHSSGLPNVHDINNPIKHGIFNFNILHDVEKELVSNVQPHTICANGYYNSYSSYVSSTEKLKAGDEISVKVSNITYLRYTKDNYFGLNLI